MKFAFWRRARPEYVQLYKLPEEIMEERCMSLEMHYGDEPLYYSDPPEWPNYDETIGFLRMETEAEK